jgi:hypothetical protein
VRGDRLRRQASKERPAHVNKRQCELIEPSGPTQGPTSHTVCKIFATRAGPSSPLTGILAQAFAEPSFQSRPLGVGQIEEVIT